MRGWQDSASNYSILDDPELPRLVEKISNTGKPVVFEEELKFTKSFVDMFPDVTLIIPHLGLLGGYPLDFLKAFKNNSNVYFDTALGSKDMIFEFVRTIGPERVLFGSDVPFGTMRSELSKVTGLSLAIVTRSSSFRECHQVGRSSPSPFLDFFHIATFLK
jgi:predicted TIM-barrel fold metal-dependent hydrolase